MGLALAESFRNTPDFIITLAHYSGYISVVLNAFLLLQALLMQVQYYFRAETEKNDKLFSDKH